MVVEVRPSFRDFLLLLPEFKRRVGIEPARMACQHVKSSNFPLEYHCCMLEDVPESLPQLLEATDLAVPTMCWSMPLIQGCLSGTL